ncbi:lipopolysaccharide heptosyltransferase I [Isosphaera pallida ATCC 43644]|uniref:lipopolysaccharide heptosyltransferase II n=1 Tax=Isosphaera pallida (strain ATCC 43644 / DSM 9630 / IS1B) TaxID=575540 RepID=E8R3B5_ISOPI|nr:lipopolysaccharide heptosyltransferase II [Isosphaera pallida]ADV63625.1 lipopolysaccharide heptosyltransferase I [Isosphaera pallida ATCC 43644]
MVAFPLLEAAPKRKRSRSVETGLAFGRVAPLITLKPRRVVLIKPSSLGDVVHALPVLGALKRLWPEAAFDWVVARGLRGLVDGHPDLDGVIPFDRPRFKLNRAGWTELRQLACELRSRRFDVTIDLQGLLRSGLMAWATGAPVRIGLQDAREGSRWSHTHTVAIPPDVTHAVDRLMLVPRLLARLQGSPPPGPPRFHPPIGPEQAAWADHLLANCPRPILAYNPGARWQTKRWPPERFAETARLLHQEFGGTILLIGANDDRPLVDRLLAHLATPPNDSHRLLASVVNVVGQTTLNQLAALLARCDLVVSNDTGPLHLAVACGAPVVGVFTCTDPERTGPYGPRAITVLTRVSCAKSLLKTCPTTHCFHELTAQRVAAAARRMLTTPVLPQAASLGGDPTASIP